MTEKTLSRACSYSACGKPYTPRQDYQRFCSGKCRARNWIDKKIEREVKRRLRARRQA